MAAILQALLLLTASLPCLHWLSERHSGVIATSNDHCFSDLSNCRARLRNTGRTIFEQGTALGSMSGESHLSSELARKTTNPPASGGSECIPCCQSDRFCHDKAPLYQQAVCRVSSAQYCWAKETMTCCLYAVSLVYLLCREGQAPTAARQGTSKIPFTYQLCGPAAESDLLPMLLPYTDQVCDKQVLRCAVK